ncbi:hypothetical protein PR048_001337 [Dryococelus australis]|uniref:Uncharacterized protein n=1 Tax=Dryococelus australis TaxID=614101 RepID=A0ABQ9IH74_9NEOP|nr:hypothetical protein PR048_001337 [Dryococelus australis]
MDQNVTKTLKTHYKKRLLTDIISQPTADITSLVKQFNIKGVIVNAAFTWGQVTSLTLIKSWKNIWLENLLHPKKINLKTTITTVNQFRMLHLQFELKLKFYKTQWKT